MTFFLQGSQTQSQIYTQREMFKQQLKETKLLSTRIKNPQGMESSTERPRLGMEHSTKDFGRQMSHKIPFFLKESKKWKILFLRVFSGAQLWLNNPTVQGKDTQNERRGEDSSRGVDHTVPS